MSLGRSVGRSWKSVPPRATFSACMPRQMHRTGRPFALRGRDERELEDVDLLLGRPELLVRFGAVDRWVQVGAAGQHEPVEAGQQRANGVGLQRRHDHRYAAGALDRGRVREVQGEFDLSGLALREVLNALGSAQL